MKDDDKIIHEHPEEYIQNNDMDRIKIFLKVRKPDMEDKSYYDIDQSNNIFTLYDQVIKGPSGKSKIYEIDKIFTNQNENSYIYEEICRDCITDSLKGNNFCFISYGETTSDKINMLYGNFEDSYSNINNRGIFPRLLEKYIETINSNEEYKNNYSLTLSLMCINGGKVIDLSKYIGKEIGELKENNFYKSGISIENNKEILNSIKKFPTDNANDIIFFLNKIFSLFHQIDFESTYHLFTYSHFIFNIYITDNNGKNISNLIFIILNGSEQLNATRNLESKETKKKSIKNTQPLSPNKKLVELSKSAVITQHTYENIITYIKKNKEINKIKEEIKDEEIEDKTMPKLITLLYNICFGPFVKNMNFRFIGNIIPNTGFYLSVKDTLDFLFKCKNIVRKTKLIEGSNKQIEKKEKEKEMIDKEIIEKKDDLIFDLENKIKIQTKSIEDLNKQLEDRDSKLRNLELLYKKQIEVLKTKFNFTGDINILLSGNEYTKEAKFARNIREANENVRIYKGRVNELEEKLKESKETIKKIKTQKEIAENDKTMLTYYQNLKLAKETHDNEIKIKNEYSQKIDSIQKELNNANKIIAELKSEIEKKNKILFNLPNLLQNKTNETLDKKKVKEEQKYHYEGKLKKKISEIEEQNLKEIKQLTEKYENLLQQKDITIKGCNNAYDTLQLNYNMEVKNYTEELIKIDETFMNVITNYKTLFNFKNGNIPNIVTMTNLKNEFDKIINDAENEINNFSYPLLFKGLLHHNKLIIHNTNLQGKKQLKRPKSSYITRINNFNNNNSMNTSSKNILKKNKSNNNLNTKNEVLNSSTEKIQKYLDNQTHDNKILLTKENLDLMEKEEIINHCLDLNKRVNNIVDYVEKYAKYKRGYNIKEFELTESHVSNLYEQIKRLTKNIDEQVDINNRNKIIIESQNRSIINLQNEIVLLKNQLEGKELNDKISFPYLKTPLKSNMNLMSQSSFNSKNKTINNYIYTSTNDNDAYKISKNHITSYNRINSTNNINKTTFQNITSSSTKTMNVFNKGNPMKRPTSASIRKINNKN